MIGAGTSKMKARAFKYTKPDPNNAPVSNGKATNGPAETLSQSPATRQENGSAEVGKNGHMDQAVSVERIIRQPFEPNPEQLPVLPKVQSLYFRLLFIMYTCIRL
jgi:hypothetical protein